MEKNLKFTKVSIPKRTKDKKWEFSIFDGDSLKGVLSFNDEFKCKDEYKKYSLNLPIEEIKNEIELSNEQQLLVLKEWNKDINNPPDITSLIEKCFPSIDSSLKDARSKYGKLIKKFLIEKGFDNKLEETKKIGIELTKEQTEYITNNCSSMRPFEMAKELFRNPRLSPASLECKACLLYTSPSPRD
jgi:hypothetical protein